MGGAGAATQRTSSTSDQWLNSNSLSEAVGRSLTQAAADTFVDPMQQSHRAGLMGSAMDFANPGAAQAAATGLNRSIMPGLQGDFAGIGAVNPAQIEAQQTRALKKGLGDLFSDEIMPGIKGGAIAAGGFGGGRQGVAEGIAAGQITDSFTQGKADIAASASRLALDRAAQRSALGSNIYAQGMRPQTAGLTVLEQLGGILGPATVLSRSRSSGKTMSDSRSTSRSRSGSATKSSGRSKDYRFSILGF